MRDAQPAATDLQLCDQARAQIGLASAVIFSSSCDCTDADTQAMHAAAARYSLQQAQSTISALLARLSTTQGAHHA